MDKEKFRKYIDIASLDDDVIIKALREQLGIHLDIYVEDYEYDNETKNDKLLWAGTIQIITDINCIAHHMDLKYFQIRHLESYESVLDALLEQVIKLLELDEVGERCHVTFSYRELYDFYVHNIPPIKLEDFYDYLDRYKSEKEGGDI